MRKAWFVGLSLALMVAGAGLALAAEERGVTPTSIKIGQWGPQTGPAALWGSVARGTGVYFQMLNDEGGINGRKIEYHLRDDGYQPRPHQGRGQGAFGERGRLRLCHRRGHRAGHGGDG